MLVYLDMCCFNRPFDDQRHPRIQLETEAKLLIQQKVRSSATGLAWSFMLAYENSANPDTNVSATIANWEHLTSITVEPHKDIIEQAKSSSRLGSIPKMPCTFRAR